MKHFLVGVIVDEPKLSLVEKALTTYRKNNEGKWDWCNVCQEETTIRKYAIPSASIEDDIFIKVKDLYKGLVPSQYDDAIYFWERNIEDKVEYTEEKTKIHFDGFHPFLKTYGTKERFATIQAIPLFWAFLIWGRWFEKGDIKKRYEFSFLTEKSVVDYAEAWNAIVNGPEIQEKYIAIVDCRIMD